MRSIKLRGFVFLPDNAWQRPKRIISSDSPNRYADELSSIVPKSSRQPFQMRKIINHIVDLDRGVTTFSKSEQSLDQV